MQLLVDMDGTIANIHDYWVERINEKLNTNHKPSDIGIWETHKALGAPERLTYDIIDEPGFFYRAKPIGNSQEVLKKLSVEHKVYIVTAASVSNNAVREKWSWLQEYYPWISKDRLVIAKDKSVVRGDYLIDDCIDNIEIFPGTAILFNQPWNQGTVASDRYRRADSWDEIYEFFKR